MNGNDEEEASWLWKPLIPYAAFAALKLLACQQILLPASSLATLVSRNEYLNVY